MRGWGRDDPRHPTPIRPGEVLLEEFLTPLGISQYRLARDLSVPPRRINEIVRGMRAITADTALRLARDFGTTDHFWLNLQARHDLEVEKDRLGNRLRREVKVLAPPGATDAGDPSQATAPRWVRHGPRWHGGQAE